MRGAKAFTLIELLVVISIIALLIAILLPALTSARASAHSVACLSNHRQMGIAWHTYAADHSDRFPAGNMANAANAAFWTGVATSNGPDVAPQHYEWNERVNGFGPNDQWNGEGVMFPWQTYLWAYAASPDLYVDPALGTAEQVALAYSGNVDGWGNPSGGSQSPAIAHLDGEPARWINFWGGNYQNGSFHGPDDTTGSVTRRADEARQPSNTLMVGDAGSRIPANGEQLAQNSATNLLYIPGAVQFGSPFSNAGVNPTGWETRYGPNAINAKDVAMGRHPGVTINGLYQDGSAANESVAEIVDAWNGGSNGVERAALHRWWEEDLGKSPLR